MQPTSELTLKPTQQELAITTNPRSTSLFSSPVIAGSSVALLAILAASARFFFKKFKIGRATSRDVGRDGRGEVEMAGPETLADQGIDVEQVSRGEVEMAGPETLADQVRVEMVENPIQKTSPQTTPITSSARPAALIRSPSRYEKINYKPPEKESR